jgi:hypothetical protein
MDGGGGATPGAPQERSPTALGAGECEAGEAPPGPAAAYDRLGGGGGGGGGGGDLAMVGACTS